MQGTDWEYQYDQGWFGNLTGLKSVLPSLYPTPAHPSNTTTAPTPPDHWCPYPDLQPLRNSPSRTNVFTSMSPLYLARSLSKAVPIKCKRATP